MRRSIVNLTVFTFHPIHLPLLLTISFYLEFSTFANVINDLRGFKRLLHRGFRYGIHYQNAKDPFISWRCTSKKKEGDTTKRCPARIQTRLINGYEMIKNVNVKHDHEPWPMTDHNQ